MLAYQIISILLQRRLKRLCCPFLDMLDNSSELRDYSMLHEPRHEEPNFLHTRNQLCALFIAA